ncbi:MAG: hypothetical protein ACREDW_01825, partial [Aestuariivirgaceae bacterium]
DEGGLPGRATYTDVLREVSQAILRVVPSADEIVLLDMIQKQFAGYSAMAHIIVATLRQRAQEAAEAEEATPPP